MTENQKLNLEIARLERSLRTAEQVASNNSQWYDALVGDLSELLGCDKNAAAILATVKSKSYFDSMRPQPTADWLRKQVEKEEGCEISAGRFP